MDMHTSHTIPLPGLPPLILGPSPVVMGILNVTPDSFSDGGLHGSLEAVVDHARRMVLEGAGIIDVGGESTRPGSEPVGVQEELDRVMPVMDALAQAKLGVPISIDTSKPLVAEQALQAGASIVNDVHGLQGEAGMAEVAASHRAPVIAMHWNRNRAVSTPVLEDIRAWFARAVAIARQAGIPAEQLILDPGFGFGKTLQENYEILRSLPSLCLQMVRQEGAFPLLIGASRKRMVGDLLGVPTEERLAGTIATSVLGYTGGGHIFRVHDVRANRDALRVAQATLYGPPAGERGQ
jgi:dihydropteroate synthase